MKGEGGLDVHLFKTNVGTLVVKSYRNDIWPASLSYDVYEGTVKEPPFATEMFISC